MMKKGIAVLIMAVLSCSWMGTVYADVPIQAENLETAQENGFTFFKSGTKNVAVRDIILTETGAGNFKKGKTIYLRAEHLQFENGADAEVTQGDLKIKDIKVKDDIMKITIDKASSEASEIRISNIRLYLDGMLADGTYSLDLVTEGGGDYPDNMFGESYGDSREQTKFSTASVTLMEDFAQISTPIERDSELNEITFHDKLVTTVGSKKMVVGDREIAMESEAYIAEYNHVMLPVRAIVEALSDTAVVNWDENEKRVTVSLGQRIFSMEVGNDVLIMNGVSIPLEGKVEIRNGRIFLPLRDLAYALGLSDSKIQWDKENQTVTLN